MTRTLRVGLAMGLLALAPHAASAAAPLQRFLLVIGANSGGTDRPQLQYAISDAERFARVMVDLGGVSPANQIVLKQPTVQDLVGALARLSARVADGRRAALAGGGGRTEVVVYYSGHADEQGLLLGGDRYSYRSLRDRLDTMPADVRIAVLDACASGAFTRLKGGRARPPFLVDESADMRGHAFLTSSAESEAAQESDRIRASYFTHYLISGFRGAADLTGDGRITLNEAYQFAFSETLRRTVDSKGGAQHPSYDINLSGTGDVVMTDVRQTSATLVLGDDVDGRFFVRTAQQELVVELYKPAGRSVALGIEPGAYDVRLERDRGSLVARTAIAEGARVVLDARQFTPATLETTTRRGAGREEVSSAPDLPAAPGLALPRFAVAGRHRIEARIGVAQRTAAAATGIVSSVTSGDILAGGQYTRFLNERVALTAGLYHLADESRSNVSAPVVSSENALVVTIPVGVRMNPFPEIRSARPLRPFIALAITPVIGLSARDYIAPNTVQSATFSETAVGGQAGGGLEVFVARSWSMSVEAGYLWMPDFGRPVGSRDNYRGVQVGVAVGWLFGRGDPPSR